MREGAEICSGLCGAGKIPYSGRSTKPLQISSPFVEMRPQVSTKASLSVTGCDQNCQLYSRTVLYKYLNVNVHNTVERPGAGEG